MLRTKYTISLSNIQQKNKAILKTSRKKAKKSGRVQKFGYTPASVKNLLRARNNRIDLFPLLPPGPRGRRMGKAERQKVIELRRANLSTGEILAKLRDEY